ncbi:phage holin family protein [Nitrospira sp. KM1]|uniref:phage holin family protein n=1 Tax=Nitrospira sp. KM1 TaxID=1936990 RepID=UPI0018D77677|nr:phage holin family protein [Nitrospira sp. KM1]
MFTRILITGIAVFLAISIVPGIEVTSLSAGFAAVLVLTLLNVLLRPILLVLAFPLIVLTLGLFLIVLNALLLELTAYLVKGFIVTGFWPAVGGSIVISVVTGVLTFLGTDRRIVEVRSTEPRQPKIINPPE